MSETAETFRMMTEEKKKRHARNHKNNMEALRISGFPFTEKDTAVLFRIDGKPKVDFYPHTGRWRICSNPHRTYKGGVQSFLQWFGKQHEKVGAK
jgi:hypothetical protein